MTRITVSWAALTTKIEKVCALVVLDENGTVWNSLEQCVGFSSPDGTIQVSINRMASDMQEYERILYLIEVTAAESASRFICPES